MSGLFAPGLGLIETRRADGAALLRCNLPLPDEERDILARLDHWAALAPNRPLLTEAAPDGTRASLGYAAARQQATALAFELQRSQQLAQGTVVASLLPAGRAALVLKLACLQAGLVHAALPPFPFRNGAPEGTAGAPARQLLAITRPKLIVLPDDHPMMAQPPSDLPLLERVSDLRARAAQSPAELPRQPVAPNETAEIYFTSGSTGTPKGVPIRRAMIPDCQAAVASIWPFLAETPPVLVDWLPWHHVFGGLDNIYKMLWNGGTLHCDTAPGGDSAMDTLRLMAEVGPTLHVAVPLALRLLLDAIADDPATGRAATVRLRAIFVAGAGIDAALWARVEAFRRSTPHVTLLSGYGATEAASTICLMPAPLHRPGELGVPLPGHDLALVETDGRREVRLSGPMVATHYLTEVGPEPVPNDAEGFYPTGDAARLERRADGALLLVFDGRLAEDFKMSNGLRVRTGPLRTALLEACAPDLQEIVVVGADADALVAIAFAAPGAAGAEDRIAAALACWNAANPGRSTAIRRFALAPAPPDRATCEVSDKGQIVRARYLRNHAELFARLQAGGGRSPHQTSDLTPDSDQTPDRPLTNDGKQRGTDDRTTQTDPHPGHR